jgi:aldehyde dehydrogenase family protein
MLMTSKLAALANQTPTVKMLVDGKFIDSQTGEWHHVVNPATQEVLAQVPFATDDEINAAVASAKRAYQTWKHTPLAARVRVMLKLQELVREHLSRIAQTLSAEQGKTSDAEGDVFRGLEGVEHACSIATLQLGEFAENVAGGVNTYTLRQPIGVCAGNSPFNFPAVIPLWMFPMAIVCGNTFVLQAVGPGPADPHAARRACPAGRRAAGRIEYHPWRQARRRCDLQPSGHRRRLLRRLDRGGHACLQPGLPARQARAMHDGRQESRRRDAGRQQGAIAQFPRRRHLRCRGAVLHGHIRHRIGG